jgi:hypothetical protein
MCCLGTPTYQWSRSWLAYDHEKYFSGRVIDLISRLFSRKMDAEPECSHQDFEYKRALA